MPQRLCKIESKMEYNEVYCANCKRVIGRYNKKYYTEDRLGEFLKANHSFHIKNGHQIRIRKFVDE